MTDKLWHGGCNCGAVRYEVRGDLGDINLCHCHQCRRFHGTPGASARTARENLSLTEERGLKWYRSSEQGRRGFCADCGASLFGDFEGDPLVYITPGSLDDDSGLKTVGHIFVAHRGQSYEITDDLPQLAEYE